jgi:hypothetical protein
MYERVLAYCRRLLEVMQQLGAVPVLSQEGVEPSH